MSQTIDEKVVEMRFNNRDFENNVGESMKTLKKFNESLDLTESAKGLSAISDASKKISFEKLSEGIDEIKMRFSALQVMAVTVLSDITRSAVAAGKRIASALTIDPIRTGFQEYETQINAVQTILANTESKGSTLEDVNKALDTLNKYADMTIYNFTEMTRNIGTFTAAGVDLDTSVKAIKGIANLAAVSGSTSQQASTAMYQLSQALASGSVKLMDWNSVVNAGMGGQVFQDALKETARVHGIAIDELIEQEGSFRETLQHGWLSSDILLETLNKFTGDMTEEELKSIGYSDEQIKAIVKMGETANDAATKVKTFTQLFDTLKEAAQSGWTQTWETVVGDFGEAKELLTEASDTFSAILNKSAEARNSMLAGWKDLGGRTALINGVRNAFQGIANVVGAVKGAFRDIFPPITSQQLFNLTKGFENLTEKFKNITQNTDKLRTTFKGFFAIVDIGVQFVKALGSAFFDLLGFISPVGGSFLDITSKIGEFFINLDNTIKETNFFGEVIGGMIEYLKNAKDAVVSFVESNEFLYNIVEKIKNSFQTAKENIQNFVDSIKNSISSFTSVDTKPIDDLTDHVETKFEPFKKIGEIFTKVAETIGKAFKAIEPVFLALGSIFGKIFSGIGEFISSGVEDFNLDNVLNLINTGLLGGILLGIQSFVKDFSGTMDSIGEIANNFNNILTGVSDTLKAFQQQIKAKTLLTIASAMGILTASIIALSLVDQQKLDSALSAMLMMFLELFGAMAALNKIVGGTKGKGLVNMTIALQGMSVAILLLTFALSKLSKIDSDSLMKGLMAITVIMAELVVVSKTMSSTTGRMMKGASNLILFGIALNVMASAVKKLGELDVASLTKGLVGIGVLCTELALFLKVTDFDGLGVSKGIGLIALGAALNILASAVEKFGAMNIETILKGLASVGAILAELAIFINLTGNAKKVTSTAIGLTILGAAMNIFAVAIGKMGEMSLSEIGKGLLAMAGSLAIMVVALKAIPKNIVTKSVGIIGLSTALVILSKALSNMGGMSWEEIGKSLVALAGSLTILVTAMQFMTSGLAGAAALLVISAALNLFVPVLKKLATMSLKDIGKSLLYLVGVFATLGLSAAVLSPLTPVILALGAAVALLGVGITGIAVGITLFSASLAALSMSATAIGVAITAIGSAIISLVPLLAEKLAEAIIIIVKAIGDGAPDILEAIGKIILAALALLDEVIGPIAETLMKILVKLTEILVEYTPTLVKNIADLIVGILEALAEKIPDIMEAAVDLIDAFLKSLGEQLPRVVDAAFQMIISFIEGLATAIDENSEDFVEAIKHLFESIINLALEILEGGIDLVKDVAKRIIGSGFIQGIKDKFLAAKNKVTELVNKCKEAITEKWEDFKQAGKELIGKFIDGIKNFIEDAKKAITDFCSTIYNAVKEFFGINSPSKKMQELGEYTGQGFVEGIKNKILAAVEAAKELGKKVVDAMTVEKVKPNIDLDDLKSKGRAGVLSKAHELTANIRPVMNDSTLNGLNTKLDVDTDKLRSSISTVISKESDKTKTFDDNKLLGAIKSLDNNLSSAIGALGGQKIYLDGKALVGELTPGINNELGNINRLGRRS